MFGSGPRNFFLLEERSLEPVDEVAVDETMVELAEPLASSKDEQAPICQPGGTSQGVSKDVQTALTGSLAKVVEAGHPPILRPETSNTLGFPIISSSV